MEVEWPKRVYDVWVDVGVEGIRVEEEAGVREWVRSVHVPCGYGEIRGRECVKCGAKWGETWERLG